MGADYAWTYLKGTQLPTVYNQKSVQLPYGFPTSAIWIG